MEERPFWHSIGRCRDRGSLGAVEPHGTRAKPGRERDARLDVEGRSQGQRVEGPVVGASSTGGCVAEHTRGGRGVAGGRDGEAGRVQILGSSEVLLLSSAPSECAFKQPHQDGPRQGHRRCRLRGYLRVLLTSIAVS